MIVMLAAVPSYVAVNSFSPITSNGVDLSAMTRSKVDDDKSASENPSACNTSIPPTVASAPPSGVTFSIVVAACPAEWLSCMEMVGAGRRRLLACTLPTTIRFICARERLPSWYRPPLPPAPPPAEPPPLLPAPPLSAGSDFGFLELGQHGEKWLFAPHRWHCLPIAGHVSPARCDRRPHDPHLLVLVCRTDPWCRVCM